MQCSGIETNQKNVRRIFGHHSIRRTVPTRAANCLEWPLHSNYVHLPRCAPAPLLTNASVCASSAPVYKKDSQHLLVSQSRRNYTTCTKTADIGLPTCMRYDLHSAMFNLELPRHLRSQHLQAPLKCLHSRVRPVTDNYKVRKISHRHSAVAQQLTRASMPVRRVCTSLLQFEHYTLRIVLSDRHH